MPQLRANNCDLLRAVGQRRPDCADPWRVAQRGDFRPSDPGLINALSVPDLRPARPRQEPGCALRSPRESNEILEMNSGRARNRPRHRRCRRNEYNDRRHVRAALSGARQGARAVLLVRARRLSGARGTPQDAPDVICRPALADAGHFEPQRSVPLELEQYLEEHYTTLLPIMPPNKPGLRKKLIEIFSCHQPAHYSQTGEFYTSIPPGTAALKEVTCPILGICGTEYPLSG